MMNRLPREALLVELADRLREKGSWAGETHVQKGAFILQEVMGVPLGFEFTLYRYGPFSFDLRDELTAMRGDGILEVQVPDVSYGPRLAPGSVSQRLRLRFPKTLEHFRESIERSASLCGNKGVAELERIATAIYVTKKLAAGQDVEARAAILHDRKPHIPMDDAIAAIREGDEILSQVNLCPSNLGTPS